MEITTAIASFAALSQDTRLKTFRLLVNQEPEGLPAGEIARQLSVPHNTMSAHLAILARSGWVTSKRQSRQDYLSRLIITYAGSYSVFTTRLLCRTSSCARH